MVASAQANSNAAAIAVHSENSPQTATGIAISAQGGACPGPTSRHASHRRDWVLPQRSAHPYRVPAGMTLRAIAARGHRGLRYDGRWLPHGDALQRGFDGRVDLRRRFPLDSMRSGPAAFVLTAWIAALPACLSASPACCPRWKCVGKHAGLGIVNRCDHLRCARVGLAGHLFPDYLSCAHIGLPDRLRCFAEPWHRARADGVFAGYIVPRSPQRARIVGRFNKRGIASVSPSAAPPLSAATHACGFNASTAIACSKSSGVHRFVRSGLSAPNGTRPSCPQEVPQDWRCRPPHVPTRSSSASCRTPAHP